MKWSTLVVAAAALSLGAPVASLAQSASGSSTQSVPRAGDASTGGSGGGSTGIDSAAPTTAAPTHVKKKKTSAMHKKTRTSHASKTKAM
jgi:hypothetical protein